MLVEQEVVEQELEQDLEELEQVEHREHFLNFLILELELLIEPLLVFLKLLYDFFDKCIVFFLRVRLEGLH
jgi:hypothetical protein